MTIIGDVARVARMADLEARGRARAQERLAEAGQARAAARHDALAVRSGQVVIRPPRQPVDGGQLLADTVAGLRHFAVWPSESALLTAALWAIQSHARAGTGLPVWQYSPRLFFTSAEGGSGKSWMTRLVLRLAPQGKMLVEATKASLVGFIAEHATVGVTELDVLVGTGGRSRWFTAIANGGFDPEPTTSKMVGGKKLEIPLFGPMVLDGLDSVITSTGLELRTLMSRCIIIRVRRAPEGYRAPRFDGQAREAFARHSAKLAAWMAQEVRGGIGEAVPDVPDGLGCRPAALWEPLLCVADAAGGEWPRRAREACADLEAASGLDEDVEAEAAYRSVFDAWAADGEDEDGELFSWGQP